MLPGAAVGGFATARYTVLSRFVLEFVLAAFVALHIQLARGIEEMPFGVFVSSANWFLVRGGRRSAWSDGPMSLRARSSGLFWQSRV